MREAAKASATMAGACTFMAQVSAGLPRGAELHGGHVDDVGRASAAPRRRARSSRSQAIVSMPACSSAGAHGGVGEARHADDALARRRALGHARQRRPHLAGDAEHEDVAGETGEVGDQLRRRLAQEVLERGNGLRSGRAGAAERLMLAFSGCAGAMRPGGAAGIGRMAAKSMSAATAKPGQASDAERQPPSVDAQARRPVRSARRDRGARGRRRPARAAGANDMPSMK